MAIPWLLIAIMGLPASEVSCQDALAFADPPPLPTEGMLFCINYAGCKLENCIFIRSLQGNLSAKINVLRIELNMKICL